MKRKEATFQEFKEFTRAVVRGERAVDPNEPEIRVERVESSEEADDNSVYFPSARSRGEAAVGQKPRAPTHDRREQAAIGH